MKKTVEHIKRTSFHLQAERMRKEEADILRRADDDAKKKIALTNMGSGFTSHLQRVLCAPFVSVFNVPVGIIPSLH